jgi:chromosome segregation ATPase
MDNFSPNQLSRDQKLIAEGIVQLGNIAEAINLLASGGVDTTEQVAELQASITNLEEERVQMTAVVQGLEVQIGQDNSEHYMRVVELQDTISNLQEERTLLSSVVQELQSKISQLQTPDADTTPDSIQEIMASLNIEYKNDN